MPKNIPGRIAHPGKQGRSATVATEEDLETIYALAKAGKSLRIIASRLGISYPALDVWMGNATKKKGDPRVRAAWAAGQAEHEDSLVSVLSQVISDEKHKMRVPSVMFMLKCKHKWSERQVVEVQNKEPPKGPTEFQVHEIKPSEDGGE